MTIEDARPHLPPRARPVAGLPLEQLLGRADELATRWAAALISERPLREIAEIPLEELAREAPGLCAQALRALESDAELERLSGREQADSREQESSAGRLGEIAGTRGPGEVVDAVEAMRGVLWEALLAELRWPVSDRSQAHLLADLADRLASVCATALAAALSTRPVLDRDEREEELEPLVPAAPSAAAARRGDPGQPPPGGGSVVIIDERKQDASPTRVAVGRGAPPVAFPSSPAPGEIEIRDERVDEGPSAWIRTVGRQLERFAQDRRPFAVLLVELRDVERMRRSELAEEVFGLAAQAERVLEAELRMISDRPPATLTREASGRYWILAPETDGPRAAELSERLVLAVRRSVSHRGAPLEVALGTAVCPEDGQEAAALAAHADVALYAARAERSAGDGAADQGGGR